MQPSIKSVNDASIKMAARRGSPDTLLLAHETVRTWLAATAPSLHTLYEAAWRAGYTANGITPPAIIKH